MRGRLDALPPAFTRGVVPVRTLVPGGVRHPHPFHKKCEEWNCKHRKINYLTLSEIRTPPVPALAQGHPPHKCGGQGRVPHPPAHHCPNSSTNSNFSLSCFRPITLNRAYSGRRHMDKAVFFPPQSQFITDSFSWQ